jgi:hypothetical protein
MGRRQVSCSFFFNVVIYFWLKIFFKTGTKIEKEKLALLAALFWSIPWSLQFSRAAFEGNSKLFLTCWGFYCF